MAEASNLADPMTPDTPFFNFVLLVIIVGALVIILGVSLYITRGRN
jgi:hypothetical protein